MRTIVITGGTDGMGAALARHYLAAGDRVVVIGRSRAKFDALPADADFIGADLSLVKDSQLVVEQLRRDHDHIDALILAASFIRQRRHVTPEGHEASWSLFFLSKYLFVTGLAGLLAAAQRPIVVNTAVPGARADAIAFDDLELADGFSFARSNAQQRRANELLGILATRQNSDLTYVTWGPARLVRTSFAGDVGLAMKLGAAVLAPLFGQDAEDAVRPIIELVDNPTPGQAAYRGAKPRPLIPDTRQDADRLAAAMKSFG